MVKNVIILFSFIHLLSIAACTPPIVHNKALFRVKDVGQYAKFEQMQTNGYYYSVYSREPRKGKRGMGVEMKILLNNGYIYNFKNGYENQCGDSVTLSCEFEMSERLLNAYLKPQKVNKNNGTIALWDWGRYDIKDGRILIQTFYNYFGDYYLLEEEGEVLDHARFKIIREKDYRTDSIKEKEEVYSFKSYDISLIYKKIPKNNVFVK